MDNDDANVKATPGKWALPHHNCYLHVKTLSKYKNDLVGLRGAGRIGGWRQWGFSWAHGGGDQEVVEI